MLLPLRAGSRRVERPVAGHGGRTAWTVLALGALATFAAVAFLVAPVRQPDVTYTWTPAAGTTVALPLMPYQPTELVASVGCAEARRGGLLLATVPPRPDPTAIPLDGLVVTGTGAEVHITSGGLYLGHVALPSGDCSIRLAARPDATVVALEGVPVLEHRGDVRPAVTGVFTDLGSGSGIALSLTTDTRFATTPSRIKVGLGALCAAALAGLLIALGEADRRRIGSSVRVLPPGWWQPRPVDAAVAGLLGVWWLVGAVTVDDGYIAGIVRSRWNNAFFGNVYRWLNAPEAPFSWFYEVYRLWALASPSTAWLRLPSTLLGLLCWALMSRLLLPRLGPAGRGRLTPWVAALALATWWVPLNLGLRPEPWVAVGTLVVFLAVERAVATRCVLPLALAVVAAGATTAVTPAGVIGFAPLLAAAVPLLRLLCARTDLQLTNSRGLAAAAPLVAALAAAAAAALLLMAADQSLAALMEAVRLRNQIGGGLPWYQEYERYAMLLAPADIQGSIGRRAAVLTTLLAAAGLTWVVAGRRTGPGAAAGIAVGPTRRLLVTVALAAVALTFSPTKWTQHFGGLAGLGATVLTLGLVAYGPAALRELECRTRNRTSRRRVAGLTGVTVVAGLIAAGQNRWPFVSDWYTPTFSTVPPLIAGQPVATLVLAAGGVGVAALVGRAVWRTAAQRDAGPPPRWAPAPAAPMAMVLAGVLALQVLSLARVAVDHPNGYTPAADLLATLRGDPCALQSVLAVEMDPAAGLLPPRPGQEPTTVRSVPVDVGGSTAPGVAIAGTGATPWFILEPRQRSGVLPVVVNVAGRDDGVSVMFARGTEVLARMPVPGGDGAPDRRLLAPSGADSVRLEVNAPAHGIGAVSLPRAPVLTPMTQVLPPGTQAILDWPVAFVFPCLEPAPLPLGTAALPRWRVAPPPDDPSAGITYTPTLGGPFASPRLLVTERLLPTYLRDNPIRRPPRLYRWEPVEPMTTVPPAVKVHDVAGWHADGRIRVPQPAQAE